MIVDSLVRWHASTVPARVLAIVDSTRPRPISVSTTGIGGERPSHQTASDDRNREHDERAAQPARLRQ